MAKKLGKRARKFARKNLQSVQRKNRKLISKIKRKKAAQGAREETEKINLEQSTERDGEDIQLNGNKLNGNLEDLFDEGNGDMMDYISDSDGYLSEDADCPYDSVRKEEEDPRGGLEMPSFRGNSDIHLEVAKRRKELDKLLEKDPGFADFLESHKATLEHLKSEEDSDDEGDDSSIQDTPEVCHNLNSRRRKVLTRHTLDVWLPLVSQHLDGPALTGLLNAFRAACHYGVESDGISTQMLQSGELFGEVLTFVLQEADSIFRKLLNIPSPCSTENFLKLKNTSRWDATRPQIKSYLRSCLSLLNQATDSQILVFTLTRLRASIVFFSAFQSLAARLIEISVHLWATGDEDLSLSSLFIIRDIASLSHSDYLETCLVKMYKGFITRCKFVEASRLKHLSFLRSSIAEICSLDVQKAYPKVLTSVQQLAHLLRKALTTKKKDDLKNIYNWQYISCTNLWVKFVASNIKDHDLQPLLFLLIQWSFRSVSSLVLDCLEYKGTGKTEATLRKHVDISLLLKVPKSMLKLQSYHEECLLCALQLLSAHFCQWSFHVSFSDLATIPLILVKRLYDGNISESIRRPLKRFIEQVEKNIDFIQKKRDEVSFSPNDQAAVESFLQLEKSGAKAAFTQHYTSTLQNSRLRSLME